MLVYLDGKYVKERDAKISAFDRGFLFGDGIFETLRTVELDKFFALDKHISRLFNSAKHIRLKIGLSRKEIKETLKNFLNQDRELIETFNEPERTILKSINES